MATFLQKIFGEIALWRAGRVHQRFVRAAQDIRRSQQAALERALQVVAGSDFARRFGLHRVRNMQDLRHALPLLYYEDYRPWIEQVADGHLTALLSPRQRLRMFATSSGTTARPKLIPVCDPFTADYRRGWLVFGLKMVLDHPGTITRAILQCTGRDDVERTRGGTPCGAITGLLARTQPRIVRRFYVGGTDVAAVSPAQARYYTLMRLAIVRDVSFAITANPATLIELARTVDALSEELIRDVHDGTLSETLVPDAGQRTRLSRKLRPDPNRAAELARLRRAQGGLRPRDYWKPAFLACWIGGSMGQYRRRLADWWGPLPVRDIGLLASEGRVSIPVVDDTPVGVLDVTAGAFEFIPIESYHDADPPTLEPHELEEGRDYAVVLSNTTGLLRYRLDDVVRVCGWQDQAPLVEFLYRAGRVASVTGEKLTENQVVAAVRSTCETLRLPEFDFVLGPVWGDPPRYRLTCCSPLPGAVGGALDDALGQQNEEYATRRSSNRLGPLEVREAPASAFRELDSRQSLGSMSAEQYKRRCLLLEPGEDDRLLQLPQFK